MMKHAGPFPAYGVAPPLFVAPPVASVSPGAPPQAMGGFGAPASGSGQALSAPSGTAEPKFATSTVSVPKPADGSRGRIEMQAMLSDEGLSMSMLGLDMGQTTGQVALPTQTAEGGKLRLLQVQLEQILMTDDLAEIQRMVQKGLQALA